MYVEFPDADQMQGAGVYSHRRKLVQFPDIPKENKPVIAYGDVVL